MDFVVGSDGHLARIPAHIAIIVARSDWLRAKVREECALVRQSNKDTNTNSDKLEVILQIIR